MLFFVARIKLTLILALLLGLTVCDYVKNSKNDKPEAPLLRQDVNTSATIRSMEILSRVTPKVKFGGFLKKTAVSDRIRLVFVAGLERSGHEVMSKILERCTKELEGKCEHAKVLSDLLMTVNTDRQANEGFFAAEDVRYAAGDAERIEAEMKQMAVQPGDHLYYVSPPMPYATGTVPRTKPLDHPDVFALAAMAEAAGLDLRIVLLQRDAEELLDSLTRHHVGGGAYHHIQYKILIANAAALYMQLMLIDRAFFYCLPYSQLVTTNEDKLNNKQSGKLNSFVHPSMLLQTNIYGLEEGDAGGAQAGPKLDRYALKYYVAQLRARLQLIERRCVYDEV